MRIVETCSCGAKLELEDDLLPVVTLEEHRAALEAEAAIAEAR